MRDRLGAGPVPLQLVRLLKLQVFPWTGREGTCWYWEAVALHVLKTSGACCIPKESWEHCRCVSQYWRDSAVRGCSCCFSRAAPVLTAAHGTFHRALTGTFSSFANQVLPLWRHSFGFLCCGPLSWRLPQLSRTGPQKLWESQVPPPNTLGEQAAWRNCSFCLPGSLSFLSALHESHSQRSLHEICWELCYRFYIWCIEKLPS